MEKEKDCFADLKKIIRIEWDTDQSIDFEERKLREALKKKWHNKKQ